MTIKDLRENGFLELIDKCVVRDVVTGRDLEFNFRDTTHIINEFKIVRIGPSGGFPSNSTIDIYVDGSHLSQDVYCIMQFSGTLVNNIESMVAYMHGLCNKSVLALLSGGGIGERLLYVENTDGLRHLVVHNDGAGFHIRPGNKSNYIWEVSNDIRCAVPDWMYKTPIEIAHSWYFDENAKTKTFRSAHELLHDVYGDDTTSDIECWMYVLCVSEHTG